MENLIKALLWLVVVGFAIYGLRCWWQGRNAAAWEQRRRIGFQPNPEPATAS